MKPNKYLPVCQLEDIINYHGKKVQINNTIIALFRIDQEAFALQNSCPHQQGDLADGFIRERKIYCPLHQWAFDLVSGRYAFNENMELKTYKVRIKNNFIYVQLD